MGSYKLYMVSTMKIRPGKFAEATKWWKEKGLPDARSRPWVKSLKCYAAQFGLAGEYGLEVWEEIENYAAMDSMDKWIEEDPKRAEKERTSGRRATSSSNGVRQGSWGIGPNPPCCPISRYASPGRISASLLAAHPDLVEVIAAIR